MITVISCSCLQPSGAQVEQKHRLVSSQWGCWVGAWPLGVSLACTVLNVILVAAVAVGGCWGVTKPCLMRAQPVAREREGGIWQQGASFSSPGSRSLGWHVWGGARWAVLCQRGWEVPASHNRQTWGMACCNLQHLVLLQWQLQWQLICTLHLGPTRRCTLVSVRPTGFCVQCNPALQRVGVVCWGLGCADLWGVPTLSARNFLVRQPV